MNYSGEGLIMLARKKKKHLKLKVLIVAFTILALTLLFAFEKLIKGKTKEIAQIKSESYAEKTINDSVGECLDKCDYEFVEKNYSNNKIVSIELKSAEVNNFKHMLMETISENLNDKKNQSFEINLGAVFSSNLLSSVGPSIHIYFQKEGSVNLDILSDFSSAGINQTIHRVYVTVDLDILAVTPSGNFLFPYSTEYVLSETVIIGDTPQMYAGISKEEKIT